MSVIVSLAQTIVTNIDLIVCCGAAGLFGYYFIPNLIAKIKKDGFQPVSDITEAVNESVPDYKNAIESIDEVIEDITVNDADTLDFIKNTVKALKLFK